MSIWPAPLKCLSELLHSQDFMMSLDNDEFIAQVFFWTSPICWSGTAWCGADRSKTRRPTKWPSPLQNPIYLRWVTQEGDGARETTLRGKWGFPCGLFESRLAHSWISCHKFLYFTLNFAMIIIFPSILFMSASRFYDLYKLALREPVWWEVMWCKHPCELLQQQLIMLNLEC